MEEEEYELVPLNPLRRMEKRLERLEKGGTSSEMIKELIDVVRTNQRVVDDVVKMNSELVTKINDTTNAVNEMIKKIDNFIERIEVSEPVTQGPQEVQQEVLPDNALEKRIDKLEKRINSLLVAALAKNKLRTLPQKRPVQA